MGEISWSTKRSPALNVRVVEARGAAGVGADTPGEGAEVRMEAAPAADIEEEHPVEVGEAEIRVGEMAPSIAAGTDRVVERAEVAARVKAPSADGEPVETITVPVQREAGSGAIGVPAGTVTSGSPAHRRAKGARRSGRFARSDDAKGGRAREHDQAHDAPAASQGQTARHPCLTSCGDGCARCLSWLRSIRQWVRGVPAVARACPA